MTTKAKILMHWNYLVYVLRHKWFVYIEGRKLHVPIWQLLIHDWQKFTPTEWSPYAWTFFGPYLHDERPGWLKEAFLKAWLHHIHLGSHHWQHWILVYDNDEEDYGLLEMSNVLKCEMLADWRAAAYAKKGIDDTKDWYTERQDKFSKLLHPNTKKFIEEQLGL